MIAYLGREFRSLDPRDKGLVHATLLAAALFLVHFVLYSPWFVEDAAITFGFARNAALGDGFVAYLGGERVEGFSNPTWTLLLALFRVVGVSPFLAAKLFGALAGLGAMALSTVWARELVGEERRHYAAIAPFLLAVQPGFVMWCASGLENPLLSFLIAGASIRSLGEIRARELPFSSVLWALVALTRPEAPLYAAIGGLVTGSAVLRSRGLRDALIYTAGWLTLFSIPFGMWHAWRWNYFAWEFPNTYYAKLGEEDRFQPWGWDIKGWKYLRSWGLATGQGFLAPIYAIGQTGVFGNRGAWGALIAGLAMVLVLPGVEWFQDLPGTPNDPEPEWLVQLRVLFLLLAAAALPLIGVGRRGDDARILAWGLALCMGFFGLYSGGDWMDGYRWPSLAVVPLTVLLTDAIASVGAALASLNRRFAVRLGVGVCVALPTVLGVVQTTQQLISLEVSPYDVRRRVDYMQQTADTLGLERPSLGEIDMGAHVWWTEWELVDLAGLLDVPVGHHTWEAPFIHEYVFKERRPDFMHMHGYWGTKTKITTHAGFTLDWVEIPPYAAGFSNQHPGNHVRRDLLVSKSWKGPANQVAFGNVAVLEGFDFEASMVAPGSNAILRFGVTKPRPHNEIRLTAFLSRDGEVVVSSDAPVLWDWMRQGDLKRTEVAHTRIHIPIPADVPPGTYDLGWVAWTRGAHSVPLKPDGDAQPDPVFSVHEVRFADALTIADEREVLAQFTKNLATLQEHAEQGRCDQADLMARTARSQRAGVEGDWEDIVRSYDAVRGQCWAARAAEWDDATAMHTAMRLAPRDPVVLQTGRDLADSWEQASEQALTRQDLDAAYAHLRDVLIADPARSWTRRRAEELRDRRLELGDFAVEQP